MTDGRDITTGRFLSGRRESEQEKVVRLAALREAWKQRPDYIGDIVSECPYIHNSWRGIMFTERGKRAGISDEWKDFRTFYNDVRPTYAKGLVLRRTDITKPFSKDNFVWLSRADASSMTRENTIRLEHRGLSLTIADWADKLGVSCHSIRNRYYKHPEYTTKEVLFGKKTKRCSKQAKDIHEIGVNIRAKASKMISSYRHKDRKNGTEECDITIEWMIENILMKPCVYCGDTRRVGCDRIDNTKGHTKNNVVPCCVECNSVRNDFFSYEEMRKLGRTIRLIKAQRPKTNIEKSEETISKEKGHDLEYVRKLNMRKVFKCDLDRKIIEEYPSCIEAAKKNNVSVKSISAAVNGNMHKSSFDGHKLKGYLWFNEITIK